MHQSLLRLVALLASIFLIGGTGYCGLVIVQDAHSSQRAAAAAKSVRPGMTLDDAVKRLEVSSDAHAWCDYADGSEHVFTYGPRGGGHSGRVHLRAGGPPGREVVETVGILDDYLMWGFRGCHST